VCVCVRACVRVCVCVCVNNFVSSSVCITLRRNTHTSFCQLRSNSRDTTRATTSPTTTRTIHNHTIHNINKYKEKTKQTRHSFQGHK